MEEAAVVKSKISIGYWKWQNGGDEFLQAKRLEEEIKKSSAQNFDSDGKSDRCSSGHVQKKIRKDSKRDI